MTERVWHLASNAMARFTKGHGLGNDYLVMAEADLDFPFAPAAIRWICHRNWGVGSDGILLQTTSTIADLGRSTAIGRPS